MAAQSRTTLKTYFNTGDTPTEAQFANLIDSAQNITDDGVALTDITAEELTDLSDVTITTPADNEVLAWNGTDAWINQTPAEAGLAEASHTHVEADITDFGTYLTDITGESIGDLSDVTITTGAQGDILYNNGTAWVNLAAGTNGQFLKTQGAAANPAWDTISGGGDMLASTYDPNTVSEQLVGLTATQTLTNKTIDADSNTLSNIALGAEATGAIDDLSDVTITTPADNEVLAWNGTDTWINQTPAEAGLAEATHTHVEADITDLGTYLTDITGENLTDLADVVITTPADNEVLAYDSGGSFINQTPAEAGLAEATHTHVEADITDLGTYMENPMTTAGDVIYGGASGAPTRLGIGTATQVLTVNAGATAPEWADAAAGGGGITIYDAEINSAGTADYTTVGAALAAGKKRLLLSSDTTETGNITLTANMLIHGNGEAFQIGMGGNQIVDDGSPVLNARFADVDFYSEASLVFNACDFADSTFDRCLFTTNSTADGYWFFAGTMDGVVFTACDFYGNEMGGLLSPAAGVHRVVFNGCDIYRGSAGTSATEMLEIGSVDTDRTNIQFNGCNIRYLIGKLIDVKTSGRWPTIGFNNCTVRTDDTSAMIDLGAEANVKFNGCVIDSNGYLLDATADLGGLVSLTNCYIKDLSGIWANSTLRYKQMVVLDNCQITNTVTDTLLATPPSSTADVRTPQIVIGNITSTAGDNYDGIYFRERKIEQGYNASATAINGGEAVITTLASATAFGVATSTTATDATFFFGIASLSLSGTDSGPIVTKGVTWAKVDGTTDIAIGDTLGLASTAGVLAKNTTADQRVAIALGAYTTDDANGVIPVYLWGSYAK